MTRNEAIKAALDKKEEILREKTVSYDAKVAKLTAESPEYEDVCRKLTAAGARLALTALGGDAKRLRKLEETIESLSKEKENLLKSAGIGKIVYDCEECHDTGYRDGKICSCVKELAKKIMLEELSQKAPLTECTFENFELSLYKDAQSLKRMTSILKLAKEYALRFDEKTSENLLFMGNTGLGKTHLSLSIAGEVICKGYDVIYGSAYNLFSDMESEHFSLHTNKNYDAAVNCDLLIIDDLGGEFVSPYIQSLVYNIINTRILNRKPTVISTNLSMQGIENIYTPRVASRLIGEYTAKMFLGNDIRQVKAFSET